MWRVRSVYQLWAHWPPLERDSRDGCGDQVRRRQSLGHRYTNMIASSSSAVLTTNMLASGSIYLQTHNTLGIHKFEIGLRFVRYTASTK